MPEYTHVYSGVALFLREGDKYYVRLENKTKKSLKGRLYRFNNTGTRNPDEIEFRVSGNDNVKYFFENTKRLLIPKEIEIPDYERDPWYLDVRNVITIYRPQERQITLQNPTGEIILNRPTEGVHFTYNTTYQRNVTLAEWHQAAFGMMRRNDDMFGPVQEETVEFDRREVERQRIADVTRRTNERARLADMYRTPNRGGNRR